MRDEQTHPHRPRLVVSHSTCPPLSSSPHAHSFLIGPAVIKHTQYRLLPPREQLCNRSCSNKHTQSQSVMAPHFTTAHFKKPVLYSSLWATLFPKCQPTTTSGRGAYTLPFLSYTDKGATAPTPAPQTYGQTPHLHATCLSKTPSDNPQPALLHLPQLAQKEVVSHPKYNHLTQLTELGPVHMFHIPGCPMPMSDKTLARVQDGNFFALARTIAQDTY